MTLLLLALACDRPEPRDTAPEPPVFPRLAATPADREAILAKLDREPYASLMARMREVAAREWTEPDPAVWDHDAHGRNAVVARANAALAWLEGDEAAAEKARTFVAGFRDGFETNTTWDVNIRMPAPLVGQADAIDLLRGADAISDEEAEAAERVLGSVTGAFYDKYVLDPVWRAIALGHSQNNHPIRTAATIGYVAMALPEHPDAEAWADFAFSELAYLWGPTGQYVQADGSVSEGPFYYGFALAPTVAFSLAAARAVPADRVFHRDCVNRSDEEPWAGHGCVPGEAFAWEDPLRDGTLLATVEWWGDLSLPWGQGPPLEDAYFNPLNGSAIVGHLGGTGVPRAIWEGNRDQPRAAEWGQDLLLQHLLVLSDEVPPEEPPGTPVFRPVGGQAVLRSGPGPDAIWALVTAEHGSARLTLHDHVDATSFSLAAWGEYLLVDPGYYKPNELDNARTSHAWAHNMVLIDGERCPDKGLLIEFGDADAFLEGGEDGERLDAVHARQDCDGTELVRTVALVRDRYLVVADRLSSSEAPREHRWRVGGNAGFEAGGAFALREGGATWERAAAGVEVAVASTAPGMAVVEPPFAEWEAPHVQEIDRDPVHHAVIDGVVTGVAPWFLAVAAPWRVGGAGDEAPLAVEALDAGPGRVAFAVTTAAGRDVILLREAGTPEELAVGDRVVRTDGALAVISLEGEEVAWVVDGGVAEAR